MEKSTEWLLRAVLVLALLWAGWIWAQQVIISGLQLQQKVTEAEQRATAAEQHQRESEQKAMDAGLKLHELELREKMAAPPAGSQ